MGATHRWTGTSIALVAGLLWLAAVLTIGWGLRNTLAVEAERTFTERTREISNVIEGRMHTYAALVQSVSSSLIHADYLPSEELRRYTERLIERYPEVYSLQVVREALPRELPRLTAEMQAAGYSSFRARAFDYTGSRDWRRASSSPVYRLIVFVAPETPEALGVLGLNITEVGFLRRAVSQSRASGAPAGSRAFTLVEGGEAYILYDAVGEDSPFVAALVVRLADLIHGYGEVLAEIDGVVAVADGTGPRGRGKSFDISKPRGSTWCSRHA